jgi:hypothetical protein
MLKIIITFCLLSACTAFAGELLYNGITLPDEWPPKIESLTSEPMEVPYLKNPPKVIPIDVGRQLFVDDFLIEQTTLTRTWHRPKPFGRNPVLTYDRPWEYETPESQIRVGRIGPGAFPFSDGVWFDPKDNLFKMWYMAGHLNATAYAISKDGIQWEKPVLDIQPATNIVHPDNRDSCTVWLDLDEKDPTKRYKMFRFAKAPKRGLFIHYSADGLHWGEPLAQAGDCHDRTTVFYNPFRKKWIYSLKGIAAAGTPLAGARIRRYVETSDPLQGIDWGDYENTPLWVGADKLDPKNPDRPDTDPQLYNLDAVAYESVMIGLFSIWQGPGLGETGRPKYNQVFIAFSRDGFHWDRSYREPFIPASGKSGTWNWGNVQSVGGGCLIVGDSLYFYHSGRGGSGRLGKENSYMEADGSTGLTILRRDGFVSMDAGDEEGTLTTRPLNFSGKYLFVNADTYKTKLTAEILGDDGKLIEPFTRENCLPVKEDSIRARLRWKNADDLSQIASRPVRIRFYLKNASLYSFWISPDESGASYGYVAAGGPGFISTRDTISGLK